MKIAYLVAVKPPERMKETTQIFVFRTEKDRSEFMLDMAEMDLKGEFQFATAEKQVSEKEYLEMVGGE